MKTITLEQLDPSTSQWLREASKDQPILVTDHGAPILTVTITPAPPAAGTGGFNNRVLRPGFEALMNRPIGGTSIDDIISQDREDRL